MLVKKDTRSNHYFSSLPKRKLLTKEEELALAVRIKNNDLEAEHLLVQANLPFVVNVAKNYKGQGIEFEDLISIGTVGLIKAAKNFDGTKNFKFITYAVWWIRQHILIALSDQSRVVRVPPRITALMYTFRKVRNRLYKEEPNMLDVSVIAEEMGISTDDVEQLLMLEKKPVFLNAPFDESGVEAIENLRAEEIPFYEGVDEKSKALKAALDTLPMRERKVIEEYYGFDGGSNCTLLEISEKYKISRERVRQIKEKAMLILKSIMLYNIIPKKLKKNN